MVGERENISMSRHREYRQQSLQAFKSRAEKNHLEISRNQASALNETRQYAKAMTQLERYEDKLNKGNARFQACKSTKVSQMSTFWDKH